jgi:hypothetical protein
LQHTLEFCSLFDLESSILTAGPHMAKGNSILSREGADLGYIVSRLRARRRNAQKLPKLTTADHIIDIIIIIWIVPIRCSCQ